MKDIKYIEDIELSDLPKEMVACLCDRDWNKMQPEQRVKEMRGCIKRCSLAVCVEDNSKRRKHLRNVCVLLNSYCDLPLHCKQIYLILLANDKYQFPLFFGDTLLELSMKSGFDYGALAKAYQRKSVVNHHYRVIKVDLRTFEEKFNFENYNKFCKKHELKADRPLSLKTFHNYCED